jgi:hypothetical protein
MMHIYVHAACPSSFPYCMSMATLPVQVHAAYPCPCCMDQYMLRVHFFVVCICPCQCLFVSACLHVHVHHEYGHAAGTWSCSIDMHLYGIGHETLTGCVSSAMLHAISMLHVHVHAACLSQCCMFKSMQHRYGHAAWNWTRSMVIHMQHRYGHAAWTCNVAWIWTLAWPSTCCLSMFTSRLHIHFHAAYPCPCCTSQYMLLALMLHPSIVQVNVHGACRMDRGMQYGLGHAARTYTWTWA